MAVDSKAAHLLISADLGEAVDVIDDSDDCSSESEENAVEAALAPPAEVDVENEEETNYNKMLETEERSYQTELLEMAKERNIIICLPTGSGKTYIALKLIEYMLPEAMEKNKKIIFLANNVPLVHQQSKYISANLVNAAISDDKYVRAITGDLNVDIWKEEQWNQVLNTYPILVMSTQILLDAITKSFVKWSDIALLILDECHHAQKNHPMAQLMKSYSERMASKAVDLPRVLGLTATIIVGKSKAVEIPKEIKEIEQLLCCRAVTTRNYEEALKRGTKVRLQIRLYDQNYKTTDAVCREVNDMISTLEKLPREIVSDAEVSAIETIDHPSLVSEDQVFNKHKGLPKHLKSFLTDLLKTYEELGPFCAKLATIMKMIYIAQMIQVLEFSEGDSDSEGSGSDSEDVLNESDDIPEEKEGVSSVVVLYNVFTILQVFMRRLDMKMEKCAVDAGHEIGGNNSRAEAFIVKNCVSNKVRILWEILEKSGNANGIDELCGLIFCQRRITAQVLRWYLDKAVILWPKELGFIRPEVMVGGSTNVNNTEEARYNAKRQTKIVQSFHEKKLNLLIATQVVEEGLNVPSCNLVVRFDPITSYPSFVQSLGRARRVGATGYALIESSVANDEANKLNGFVTYTESLIVALQNNVYHVGDDEVTLAVDPLPPFRPSGTTDGPEITSVEAISRVHQYCSGLSCDKVAALVPVSWWSNVHDSRGILIGFKAYLQLPILSPVRDVLEGELMTDKTLAKRSVYLKACEKLYEAGELTKHLLPKPRTIDDYKCQFLDNLAEQFKQEKETVDRKIGSRGRTQWYTKKKPASILESTVEPSQPVFVYKVKIKLHHFTGDSRVKNLYDFKKYRQSFGIMTRAKIDVPSFTLHANYGNFVVSIKKVVIGGKTKLLLTPVQISTLESFQVYLRYSYGIKHPILTLDEAKSQFVVPLVKEEGEYDINWDLVDSLLKLDETEHLLSEPSESLRKQGEFALCKYENAVLVPWYKEDKSEPELLTVIQVLQDYSANSEFEEPKKFPTYANYYQAKYGVDVFHPENPLILCKDVGKQLNFLSKKVDSKILRKDMQRSLLKMVPELLNIHPIPSTMFVQGRLLPSILHRVERLLVANEIRLQVAAYFDWNVHQAQEAADPDASFASSDNLSDEEDDDIESQEEGEELEDKPPSPKRKKREFLSLNSINPFEFSWDLLDRVNKPRSKRVRDICYNFPEPPTTKSDVCKDLVDIDDLKFPSFDKETDFSVEKGPDSLTIMEALTLSNAQDSLSLEKLEVMGDSVLKLVVSLHLFRSFPTWDEGKMTLLRMKLISNLHLYQLGKEKNIGDLLSGGIFIPDKNWLPSGFQVPRRIEEYIVLKDFALDYDAFQLFDPELGMGDLDELLESQKGIERVVSHSTFTHSRIGDKSVADAMESIIGAYYVNGGLDSALRIMEWLGLRGPLQDGSVELYSRESIQSPFPREESGSGRKRPSTQKFLPLLKDLEEVIGYKFKDPWLAVEALTHPTFVSNRITPPYERLEFVGDAILDFLVTNYILKNTDITDPGKITDLRAALVNNVTFGSLSVRYGFHIFLRYHSKLLGDFISRFADYQEENNHEVSDPHKLYSDFDCPTVREIEVPKVLGDIFESLAGAVYVDSGMSIDTVWKVFYRLMKKELEKFSKNIPKAPLRELYEMFPGKVQFSKVKNDNSPKDNKSNSLARYQIVLLKLPLKDERRTIGVGATIKEAKQAAAKYIMKKIKSKKVEY